MKPLWTPGSGQHDPRSKAQRLSNFRRSSKRHSFLGNPIHIGKGRICRGFHWRWVSADPHSFGPAKREKGVLSSNLIERSHWAWAYPSYLLLQDHRFRMKVRCYHYHMRLHHPPSNSTRPKKIARYKIYEKTDVHLYKIIFLLESAEFAFPQPSLIHLVPSS